MDRQVEGGDEKEPDGGKTRKDGRKQPHGGSAERMMMGEGNFEAAEQGPRGTYRP